MRWTLPALAAACASLLVCAAPARAQTAYEHPTLHFTFEFPKGWKAGPQNSSGGQSAEAPKGGAVLTASGGPNTSGAAQPADWFDSEMKAAKARYPSLRVLGKRYITIGTRRGMRFDYAYRDPARRGLAMRAWRIVIVDPAGVDEVAFEAPGRVYKRDTKTAEAALRTWKPAFGSAP
ncbi:MAG: hypothetical protein KGL53_01795 [Elusimicrobia bacterium]|nr:hypothetical protein [Elusimicrobiota bacterium]